MIKKLIKKLSTFYFQLLTCFRAKRESGVTLIELMAAISIFTATLMVVMTVLIAVISSQRRSANAINIENAAYFAMETISKEIRTGKDFSCTSGTDDNCVKIKFTNYRGDVVSYKKSDINNQIEKECNINNSGICADGVLTPENLNASYFEFDLFGIAQPDNKQPKITIVIKIETLASTPEPQKRDLKLQTTISSRQPDS